MRYLYTYVIAALVTTAKAEATQVSIHRKIHKQNMAHPYNEVLFSLKMEGNADSGYSMEEPWGHYANRNRPVTKTQALHESTYMRYLE